MRIRLMSWKVMCLVAAAGVAVAYRRVARPMRRKCPKFRGRDQQRSQSLKCRRMWRRPPGVSNRSRGRRPPGGSTGSSCGPTASTAEADRCFQVAADLDPADGRWPYLIGIHLADADPAAAVAWLERAAHGTVPAEARETVRARLAETLLAAGRPADALAALGPDPAASSPRIRLAAARAAAAAGDDRAAAEFLGDLADYPSRRPAGAVVAVGDLSPAGPHVLRRLPGASGRRTPRMASGRTRLPTRSGRGI